MSKQENSDPHIVIAEVALPVPLRCLFDYKIPDTLAGRLQTGARLVVPFGRRTLTGLVVGVKHSSQIPDAKIRSALKLVDDEPVVSGSLFRLLNWVADYYQQPLGEVIRVALPGCYLPRPSDLEKTYQLSGSVAAEKIMKSLARAPKQQKIAALLLQKDHPVSSRQLEKKFSGWRNALNSLIEKQLVEVTVDQRKWPVQALIHEPELPKLSEEQQGAIAKIGSCTDGFVVSLLQGVTGSGKTEVYTRIAAKVLGAGKQILVLVPEIALTPQLVSRFEQRLGLRAAVLHSSLSEKARRLSWRAASNGQARVILGTRSAVFAPIPDIGLIILDEEHDMSYKQQEGVRYHARDVAVMRAKQENIAIILGSATPSLESLANVMKGRYQLCELKRRVADAVMPEIHLLSLDQLKVYQGLSMTLIKAIEKNLKRKQQTLIFINRRGFAPIVICRHCGETATCQRCHARLIYHSDGSLQCHHCGGLESAGDVCRSCGANTMTKLGQGTQRIERVLKDFFPQARIARLDRDVTRKKDKLESVLETMLAREVDILIGTQMLVKGHDFPMVTLVGIINADQGLFGLDFHATESMIQQLIQVSGRAGRAKNQGKVLIQTHFPEHPLYAHICRHDYSGFALRELKTRQQAGFPPYHFLALIRAWDKAESAPLNFLASVKAMSVELQREFPMVKVLGPVYSPMAKLKNLYRAQLLVSSSSRAARQQFLKQWIGRFEGCRSVKSVRWSIDVDPVDLY